MTLKKPFDLIRSDSNTDITRNLKDLEKETLGNLVNSKAANTLRAYSSDYKDFEKFCSSNNLKSMPTTARILSLYLTKLSKTAKFSTLKRRLASIKMIHKRNGHYIDTKHPMITEIYLESKGQWGAFKKLKTYIIND